VGGWVGGWVRLLRGGGVSGGCDEVLFEGVRGGVGGQSSGLGCDD